MVYSPSHFLGVSLSSIQDWLIILTHNSYTFISGVGLSIGGHHFTQLSNRYCLANLMAIPCDGWNLIDDPVNMARTHFAHIRKSIWEPCPCKYFQQNFALLTIYNVSPIAVICVVTYRRYCPYSTFAPQTYLLS